MDYEVLLGTVKEMSLDQMKRFIFKLDQHSVQQVKKLDVDEETKKNLIMILKDRTFFEMLLANALIEIK